MSVRPVGASGGRRGSPPATGSRFRGPATGAFGLTRGIPIAQLNTADGWRVNYNAMATGNDTTVSAASASLTATRFQQSADIGAPTVTIASAAATVAPFIGFSATTYNVVGAATGRQMNDVPTNNRGFGVIAATANQAIEWFWYMGVGFGTGFVANGSAFFGLGSSGSNVLTAAGALATVSHAGFHIANVTGAVNCTQGNVTTRRTAATTTGVSAVVDLNYYKLGMRGQFKTNVANAMTDGFTEFYIDDILVQKFTPNGTMQAPTGVGPAFSVVSIGANALIQTVGYSFGYRVVS